MIENIILWRHADAGLFDPNVDDLTRPISQKGLKQAKKMAKWLKKYLPRPVMVYTSPALRALQTAQIFMHDVQVVDVLNPDTTLNKVQTFLAQCDDEHLVIVGHQPWLVQLITHLMGINNIDMQFKKGAIWWLRLSKSSGNYKLYVIQNPEFLT